MYKGKKLSFLLENFELRQSVVLGNVCWDWTFVPLFPEFLSRGSASWGILQNPEVQCFNGTLFASLNLDVFMWMNLCQCVLTHCPYFLFFFYCGFTRSALVWLFLDGFELICCKPEFWLSLSTNPCLFCREKWDNLVESKFRIKKKEKKRRNIRANSVPSYFKTQSPEQVVFLFIDLIMSLIPFLVEDKTRKKRTE